MRKIIKRLIIAAAAALALLAVLVLAANLIVTGAARDKIADMDRLSGHGADCALILGAGVWGENTPSPMLKDRLDAGIALYKAGIVPKLLMSGDHGKEDYDEVNAMKDYAINAGVPAGDIFMDHAGFSTYESIYRAKEVFLCKKIIVVTQEYHIYRALYDADSFGMDAMGYTADARKYAGEGYRQLREAIARAKDLAFCFYKPEPKYLGEAIPISGSGSLTDDK